jgi:hypothetical protein
MLLGDSLTPDREGRSDTARPELQVDTFFAFLHCQLSIFTFYAVLCQIIT